MDDCAQVEHLQCDFHRAMLVFNIFIFDFIEKRALNIGHKTAELYRPQRIIVAPNSKCLIYSRHKWHALIILTHNANNNGMEKIK